MPNLVKAYSCSHGCARRILTSKKAMAAHENRCKKNDASRACASCLYDQNLECEINAKNHDQKIVFNCPQWRSKNIDCEEYSSLESRAVR